jgi:thiol-disulfide isomerase/thioredoxin
VKKASFQTRISIPLVLVTVLPAAACGEGGDPAGITPDPDIRVVDHDGLEAALEAHRGKGVLLNFWAIWCKPCVAELPALVETAMEYRERGGVVLGVSYDLMVPGANRDAVLEKMRSFVSERWIDFPVLIYDEDDYDAINERFDLPGEIPVTLALDRNGEIVDRQEDSAEKARFVEMMEKALAD